MSLIGWMAFGLLTAFALNGTYLPGDLAVAHWVQSFSWGALAITFPWISWLTGTGQVILVVLLVLTVAVVNRRAVPFALIAALGVAFYWILNLAVHKPRPTAALIRVIEHPGAYSFPSGHATLAVIVVAVLVLVVARRYFRGGSLALIASVGVLVVLTIGIQRIYVGAHYPSDVLGGFLLACSTVTFALSLRSVGGPIWAVRSTRTRANEVRLPVAL